MASKPSICNMALGRIQVGKRIQNLDSDASSEAGACRDVYDHCRDEVLHRFRWKFAEAQSALAQLGGTTWSSTTTFAAKDTVTYAGAVYISLQATNLNRQPDISGTFWRKVSRDPWSYVYALPADCVAPREIFYVSAYPRDFETPPYDLVADTDLGTLLLCSLLTPDLRYTFRHDTPERYPPPFVNSLANRLSVELAGSVKGDPMLADARLKVYERQVLADFGAECNTTEPGRPPESMFITARG